MIFKCNSCSTLFILFLSQYIVKSNINDYQQYDKKNSNDVLKKTASSMQHEAKIAYYAFDVIRFFVPYAARLKLRGRVAR